MKLNKYIKWMLGATMALSGCADDDFINRDQFWDGVVPDELTLTITVPDPEVVNLGSTRGDNGPINTLTLLQYDGTTLLQGKNLEFTPTPESDGTTYKITATLDKSCTAIQIVSNYTVGDNVTDLSSVAVSAPRDLRDAGEVKTAPILWGYADLSSLLTGNAALMPTISLMRQTAKLIVENNADNFTITEFSVHNMPTSGTVAPSLANMDNTGVLTKATVISGMSYTDEYKAASVDDAIYMFESSADIDGEDHSDVTNLTRRILIKGIYEGEEYYYVAAFRSRTPGTSTSGASDIPGKYSYETIDVLRNHIYKLSIQEVRGIGWKNREDALKSLPDNRATIWLGDITPEITDMIATRDYMLGVSGAVETPWNEPARIKVVTSYPVADDSELKDLIEITVQDNEDKEWMHPEELDSSMVTSETSLDPVSKKTIRTLVINVPLSQNNLTSEDREGILVVRTGKLTRNISVIQQGRPLRKDRETQLHGLTTSPIMDYYDWVENKVKGMRDEDNRIAVGEMSRNEALIFAAVPAYNLYYRIKKESNDQTPVISGTNASDFTVTSDGDYWKVEAVTTDEPHIASAVLTISNPVEGGVIKTRYNLLQCGFFHELKDEYQQYMSPLKRPETGWYYYEVVSKNGFYTLDRNIGAASNESYNPSGVNYSADDDRAIGAYLKANSERPTDRTNQQDRKTITEKIGMKYTAGRFIIPSRAEMNQLGLLKNATITGNSISVTGLVNNRRIYFPLAGYYYGSQYKDGLHANLWTRSLLMGTQGLTETDEEYGCSYEGLDIFGGKVTYAAFRLANGSDGSLGSVWRYLPVRPVWRNNGQTLDTPIADDAQYETEYTGPITIWVKQSVPGWNDVNIYAWNDDDEDNHSFPGEKMVKNQTHNGQSGWYKATIDSKYQHLIFGVSTGNQTGDITYYREDHKNATEFDFIISDEKTVQYTVSGFSSSRPTVTVMLKNGADWTGDCQIEFEDGKSGANRIRTRASKIMTGKKVTYEGEKYYQFVLNESDIPALNGDGFQLRFLRSGNASSYFSEISSKTSQNTFFYDNTGTYSFNSSITSIDQSKIKEGWDSMATGDNVTLYFWESAGNVPQYAGNTLYIKYQNDGSEKSEAMTLETINGVRWWKYTSLPKTATEIRIRSHQNDDSYASNSYSGLSDDVRNHGTTLYYRIDLNDDWKLKRVGNPRESVTFYYKESAGNVPQFSGNTLYIKYTDAGSSKSEAMTLETINGVRWWKYTSLPMTATEIRIRSNKDNDSYASAQFEDLIDDVANHGTILYYELNTGDGWKLRRVADPH